MAELLTRALEISPVHEVLIEESVLGWKEFELELIRERVKAGMDRARKQGKRIGRPRVTDRKGFNLRFAVILERVVSGEISRRYAARELGIGYATLKRLMDTHSPGDRNSG